MFVISLMSVFHTPGLALHKSSWLVIPPAARLPEVLHRVVFKILYHRCLLTLIRDRTQEEEGGKVFERQAEIYPAVALIEFSSG